MNQQLGARAAAMTACLLLFSATASAEPPPAPAEPPRPTPTWGVIVIATSLVAGAALTGYGLTIDCRDDDHTCHRRASLPIWGGVGVAAAGTIVGLQVFRF